MKIINLLFRPLEWIAGIPPDKNKHWRWFGLFYLVVVAILSFTELDQVWMFVIALLATIIVAGAKEVVWDKWMHKGTPEWADFWYSITLPTFVTFFVWMVNFFERML